MKGTGPLDNNEILLVSACFDGNPFEIRNSGLFMLGMSTGGRISDRIPSISSLKCRHSTRKDYNRQMTRNTKTT